MSIQIVRDMERDGMMSVQKHWSSLRKIKGSVLGLISKEMCQVLATPTMLGPFKIPDQKTMGSVNASHCAIELCFQHVLTISFFTDFASSSSSVRDLYCCFPPGSLSWICL